MAFGTKTGISFVNKPYIAHNELFVRSAKKGMELNNK